MDEKNDICQIKNIHEKNVSSTKKQMLQKKIFNNLSNLFKTFGDNTRIQIIYALSKKELCVCDISTILDVSISAISHQLRILRNTGIVKYRKEGKNVFYSLDDEHIIQLLNVALEHISE